MELPALVYLVSLMIVHTSFCIHSLSLYIALTGADEVDLAFIVVMLIVVMPFVQGFSTVACRAYRVLEGVVTCAARLWGRYLGQSFVGD